jgi:EF-hand domain-containing family member B
MMRWTLDRSEDVYHSNTREPLGRGWVRGHKLPQHLGEEVSFGKCVNAKANSAVSMARHAIAPVDLEPEVLCRILLATLQAASSALTRQTRLS